MVINPCHQLHNKQPGEEAALWYLEFRKVNLTMLILPPFNTNRPHHYLSIVNGHGLKKTTEYEPTLPALSIGFINTQSKPICTV